MKKSRSFWLWLILAPPYRAAIDKASIFHNKRRKTKREEREGSCGGLGGVEPKNSAVIFLFCAVSSTPSTSNPAPPQSWVSSPSSTRERRTMSLKTKGPSTVKIFKNIFFFNFRILRKKR